MDVRELKSPDDYTPYPFIRYNVLRVEPHLESWRVQIREVQWDSSGSEIGEPRDQVMDSKRLKLVKLLWQGQGFYPVAHYQDDQLEVVYYENRADQRQHEAETSTTLPASLEVWISPHTKAGITFRCQVPQTIAFSLRSDEELAQQDIGHTEIEVSERRGSLPAKVYWVNGQPSADAQARWQPIIEGKVREYLKTSISQSTNVFVKGILEESVRQGDDARDLIMARVDLPARLAQLKTMDYQPMAE